MVDKEQKYSLSFTSIGARRLETVEVARAYVNCSDWAEVRCRIVKDDIISLNKESTRKRVGGEIIKRLRMLDVDEVSFLANAVDDDQLAMTWVAICRAYPVLHSFSTDVVAARFAKMVPDVPRTAWAHGGHAHGQRLASRPFRRRRSERLDHLSTDSRHSGRGAHQAL